MIRFEPKKPLCDMKSKPKPLRKTVGHAPVIRAKPQNPVSDDTPTMSAEPKQKYDRNAAHKEYMKEYMRDYRKRQKEKK